MSPDDAAIFAEYHRVGRARSARLVVAGGAVVVLAIFAGFALSPALAQPVPASAPAALVSPSPSAATPLAIPTETPSPAPVVLPSPASAATAATEPPVATDPNWSIRIGATGYQTELDACQWVRMDLAAVASIVGAHNSCGGAIVITMEAGDPVSLAGQGLDGAYVVAEARDAHAGDVAAAATAGMTADVILQTCYSGTGGRVRLVALLKAA